MKRFDLSGFQELVNKDGWTHEVVCTCLERETDYKGFGEVVVVSKFEEYTIKYTQVFSYNLYDQFEEELYADISDLTERNFRDYYIADISYADPQFEKDKSVEFVNFEVLDTDYTNTKKYADYAALDCISLPNAFTNFDTKRLKFLIAKDEIYGDFNGGTSWIAARNADSDDIDDLLFIASCSKND